MGCHCTRLLVGRNDDKVEPLIALYLSSCKTQSYFGSFKKASTRWEALNNTNYYLFSIQFPFRFKFRSDKQKKRIVVAIK